MRSSQYRGMICGSLLALGLSVAGAAASPVLAQDTAAARMQTPVQTTQTDGDDDHDWGWLGLLGLAGLLGLRRRDHHVRVDHVDTTRTERTNRL